MMCFQILMCIEITCCSRFHRGNGDSAGLEWGPGIGIFRKFLVSADAAPGDPQFHGYTGECRGSTPEPPPTHYFMSTQTFPGEFPKKTIITILRDHMLSDHFKD